MRDLWSEWGALAPVLEFLVKAGLVWLVGAVVVLALRRASAAAREGVWRWTCAGVLALPFAMALLPGWAPVRLTPGASAVAPPAWALRRKAPPTVALEGPSAAAREPRLRRPAPAFASAGPGPASSGTPTAAPRVALALWLAGAALVLGPALAGLAALGRLRRRGAPVEAGVWREELEHALAARGLAKRVDLVHAPRLAVPMIWEGTPRGAALLAVPTAALDWPRARVRTALAHELGHLVRHDGWAGLGARVALALTWPLPWAWWGWRRLLAEGERACDDLVLAGGERPSRYAAHLVALAGEARRGWTPATPVARRGVLEERVEALLDERRPRSPARRATLVAGVLSAGLVAPLGSLAARAQAAGLALRQDVAQDSEAGATPVEQALARGLARLVTLQDLDTGAWLGDVGYKLSAGYRATAQGVPHVGVTALALEALLATGATPGEGELGTALQRGAAYLVRAQETDPGHVQDHGSRLKSHGLATALLAKLAASTGDERLREVAQAAVDFTVLAGAGGPGWRYEPLSSESDLLNTVFQVRALKAARDTGLRVPESTLTAALAHVLEHREGEGGQRGGPGFRYATGPDARLTVATSAAGLLALAGEDELDPEFERAAVDRLRELLPGLAERWLDHYLGWTGRWLGAQALRAAAEDLDRVELWEADRERLRTELLKLQLPDGSWPCSEGPGVAFSTAVACQLLQL